MLCLSVNGARLLRDVDAVELVVAVRLVGSGGRHELTHVGKRRFAGQLAAIGALRDQVIGRELAPGQQVVDQVVGQHALRIPVLDRVGQVGLVVVELGLLHFDFLHHLLDERLRQLRIRLVHGAEERARLVRVGRRVGLAVRRAIAPGNSRFDEAGQVLHVQVGEAGVGLDFTHIGREVRPVLVVGRLDVVLRLDLLVPIAERAHDEHDCADDEGSEDAPLDQTFHDVTP